ncbi:MAG: ribosome silencing factor [Spirochaetia bacterium]|nr:ribosome silencing factor [Spirochaetia bacterium]
MKIADKTLNNIIDLCDNNKAEDIVLLKLDSVHSYLSLFLILTASSKLHLKKIANDIIFDLKQKGFSFQSLPTERDFESGWVILDCHEFIVHIFLEEQRKIYALEELWHKAEKIKF